MTKDNFKEQIKMIVQSSHWDPFEVLGNHLVKKDGKKAIAIRAFLPESSGSWVIDLKSKKLFQMERIHRDGFFEVVIPEKKDFFPYQITIKTHDGNVAEFHDPYSFLPVLTKKEEPYDCAGSAKSESLGIALMERMDSPDPTALIGLPLMALTEMLLHEGVDVLK